LGNVRLSYTKNSSTGVPLTVDQSDYYPFGLKQASSATSSANTEYNYKYQGQELQETGFYSFKWRNYMPDVGRFFNVDPLAEKYPYNTPYAFQENKMGMGVELEGLELLKNHTAFFAIHGNSMQVKRAPISQIDSNGRATFTAGDIGLSTSGYNPNGARMSTGTTGLRLNSYGYKGPTPSDAKMENIRGDDRPTNIWNKIYDPNISNATKGASGIKELFKLINLAVNIPDAVKGQKEYVQAAKDVNETLDQAKTMDQAIKLVNSSSVDAQSKGDVTNFVLDGTLPDGNSFYQQTIIWQGRSILNTNSLPVQPTDAELKKTTKVNP
ncbi:MAG: hypothetical protein H7Z76_13015, partial [Methylotenera sp.]|nr:hypothetical protein [Flavobacterium sp.]